MKKYALQLKFNGNFQEAIEKTISLLKEEGFGILSDIDVALKMKETLNKDMEPYRILGACHPASAYQVIKAEPEIGLFLPCNVVVRQDNSEVYIDVVKPSVMMGMVEADIEQVANDIEKKLERVVSLLASD